MWGCILFGLVSLNYIIPSNFSWISFWNIHLYHILRKNYLLSHYVYRRTLIYTTSPKEHLSVSAVTTSVHKSCFEVILPFLVITVFCIHQLAVCGFTTKHLTIKINYCLRFIQSSWLQSEQKAFLTKYGYVSRWVRCCVGNRSIRQGLCPQGTASTRKTSPMATELVRGPCRVVSNWRWGDGALRPMWHDGIGRAARWALLWAVTVLAPLNTGKCEEPPQRKSNQCNCSVSKCSCSIHLSPGLACFLLHKVRPLLYRKKWHFPSLWCSSKPDKETRK